MSKKANHVYNKLVKVANADLLSTVGGFYGGYSAGRNVASGTANMASNYGYKTQNENMAKNIATVLAPVGALAGMSYAYKYSKPINKLITKYLKSPDLQEIARYSVPFLSGTAGGAATGTAVGGLTSLRGITDKKKKK